MNETTPKPLEIICFCPHCNKETPKDSLHCINCGFPMLDDERDRDERPRCRGRDLDLKRIDESTEIEALKNAHFMQ